MDATKNDNPTQYPFFGKHLLMNYGQCNSLAIRNHSQLLKAMYVAIQACQAEVLDVSEHRFSNDGYSAVMLLSESHASIHTYPEFNACFLDIFTCGYRCVPEQFEHLLRKYLQPKVVSIQTIIRDSQGVHEVECAN